MPSYRISYDSAGKSYATTLSGDSNTDALEAFFRNFPTNSVPTAIDVSGQTATSGDVVDYCGEQFILNQKISSDQWLLEPVMLRNEWKLVHPSAVECRQKVVRLRKQSTVIYPNNNQYPGSRPKSSAYGCKNLVTVESFYIQDELIGKRFV